MKYKIKHWHLLKMGFLGEMEFYERMPKTIQRAFLSTISYIKGFEGSLK